MLRETNHRVGKQIEGPTRSTGRRLVNRRAPAVADIQTFFGVTPPTAHRMVIELERRGLISRTPRQARSIVVCVPREEIPQLNPQSIEITVPRY